VGPASRKPCLAVLVKEARGGGGQGQCGRVPGEGAAISARDIAGEKRREELGGFWEPVRVG
jgi:hypothetical protein